MLFCCRYVLHKTQYLDWDFQSLCRPLAAYNGRNKRFHVENCEKTLPQEITDNISKVGGTTEGISLFDNKHEIRLFYREIERSKLYYAHKKLIKKYYFNRKALFQQTKKTVRRLLFLPSRAVGSEELKMRMYINCKYILLFEQLFISGDYDSEFLNDSPRFI